MPELNEFSGSGYYGFLLGYNVVHWFVEELLKSDNRMNVYFKNTKKLGLKTQEYEKHYGNTDIFWFCERK